MLDVFVKLVAASQSFDGFIKEGRSWFFYDEYDEYISIITENLRSSQSQSTGRHHDLSVDILHPWFYKFISQSNED